MINVYLHNFSLHNHFYCFIGLYKIRTACDSVLLGCHYLYMSVFHMRPLSFSGIGSSFVHFPKIVYSNCHIVYSQQFCWLNERNIFYLNLKDFTWKAYWTIYTFHICMFLYLTSLKSIRIKGYLSVRLKIFELCGLPLWLSW